MSKINIDSFTLESSFEVENIIKRISHLKYNHFIIHISSYIHNTVMVQTLKNELQKLFPESDIVLVKHDDKTTTVVDIFSVDELKDDENLEDIIIKELNSLYSTQYENTKNCRSQLFSRYFTDHLTNLPNVYQLRKDLQYNEEYGLVLIKIDNFQTINNFYGFIIGDYVIEQVAKYLKESIKEHKVYRLSGAEFAFTMEKSLSFYELKNYLAALYEEISKFYVLYQHTNIFLDLTIASTSSNDNQHIFSKVSMALHYAKSNGLAFWIYEDRMNFENDYERNLKLSGVVRDGVKNSRIVPYFQAIVDNKTSKIVKYECLARLIDENNNVLPPILFIPIAKKIKVYNEITKQMIEKSFLAFEDTEYEFNINLSLEDIMSNEIYDYILAKLKEFSSPSRVTFEILESESIKDFTKVEKFVNEVKRYGSKIAIDDFGSGYSNFFYLTKIKANYIKIDGSLIENIHIDKSSLLVVETIVNFAKKLGMKTVAEYVHSSVVMNKVKELGIDYSQGFYIDEPSLKKVQ
jgi:diguanylate cyclase (GGDEF)-like protein